MDNQTNNAKTNKETNNAKKWTSKQTIQKTYKQTTNTITIKQTYYRTRKSVISCNMQDKNDSNDFSVSIHVDPETDDTDAGKIVYDVFISFSEKDQQFAKALQQNIESQGYKCCFHHRDFCPGEAIVKSITDAIYQSLVTLVVLTPDYIDSKWCRQELNQALTAAIGIHRVLPVIYKPCKKIPRQIRSCVTYLEYKSNNKKQFWKKLIDAIENFCGHSNHRISSDSAV